MIAYLIDRKSKERIAFGTDIGKIQMLHDTMQVFRPCFLLTVFIGGRWGTA
jgi:hypothetical protein